MKDKLTSVTASSCLRVAATGGPTNGTKLGTRPALPMRMLRRAWYTWTIFRVDCQHDNLQERLKQLTVVKDLTTASSSDLTDNVVGVILGIISSVVLQISDKRAITT